MSQIKISPAEPMTSDAIINVKAFRFPNPLRTGLLSFVATLAVAGGALAMLNVVVNHAIDAHYGQKIAEYATVPNDPAYAKASEISKAAEADDAAQPVVTVAN